MTEAHRRKRLDIEDIETIIENFQSGTHEEYMAARAALIAHDMYSVPYLLELLTKRGEEHTALIARTTTTLRDIGRSASMPLLAALRTEDEVLQHRIVSALEKLGDRRALPALVALTEDPHASESIQQSAWAAIDRIQQRMRTPIELQSASEEYVTLARLYLREETDHVGHVLGDHTEIWGWEPEADTVGQSLTLEFVPSYISYQVRGTRMALTGLRLEPANPHLQGLLIALIGREMAHLERYSKEGKYPEHRLYAEKRLEHLAPAYTRIANLYGCGALASGLREVMATHDPHASVRIIQSLSMAPAPDPDSGEALCAALDYEHANVRLQAALAILQSFPEGEICSPEKTIRIFKKTLELEDPVEELPEHRDIVRNILEITTKQAPFIQNYPLDKLEPALVSALDNYDDDQELQHLIIRHLTAFGTEGALTPMSAIAADETAQETLRVQACRAIEAILTRKHEPPGDYVEQIAEALYNALQSEVRDIQREAAAALNALMIGPENMLSITDIEIQKTRLLTPDDMLDMDENIKLEDKRD